MKNIFRISLVILAIVLCLGVFASCKDNGETAKDPAAVVEAANQKYLDALESKFAKVTEVFSKLEEGTMSQEITFSVPEFAELSVGTASDAANGTANGKLAISAMGIAAEADIWLDKSNVALSIPALLGEGTYGIKLDTLKDDIKSAPILDAIGVTYEELISAIESQGISLDDISKMMNTDSINSAMEKYTSDVKAVFDGITPVIAEETIDEVQFVTAQYTITKDTFEKLDKSMTDMIKAVFGELMSDESFDEIPGFSTEDFTDITTKCYIAKESEAIRKIEVTLDENNSLVISLSDANAKPLDMTAAIVEKVEDYAYDITLTIKESADEGKSGVYVDVKSKITADGETTESTGGFSFIVDDATGKYEFEAITDGVTDVLVTGDLVISENEFTFSIDSVDSANEEESFAFTLSYSAKAGGEVESVPEYTNILDLSATDLQDLMLDISSSPIGSLLIMGGLEGEDDEYYDDIYDEYYDEELDDEYWETYEWDTEEWDDEYWDTYEWDTEE